VVTPTFAPIPDDLNELSRVVVDCAFRVHKALGPGLLESTYRLCLVHELKKQKLEVKTEVALPYAMTIFYSRVDTGSISWSMTR
jgi:GxxExxY protein